MRALLALQICVLPLCGLREQCCVLLRLEPQGYVKDSLPRNHSASRGAWILQEFIFDLGECF